MDETLDIIGKCPFMQDSMCYPSCMLFVNCVDGDTTNGSIMEGEGACSLAIMASHIASEKHSGGNYLVKVVDYKLVGVDSDDEEDVDR